MKRLIKKLLSILLSVCLLIGCFSITACKNKKTSSKDVYYTVTFSLLLINSSSEKVLSSTGPLKKSVQVQEGKYVQSLSLNELVRSTARIIDNSFSGWYQDEQLLIPWAFYTNPVNCDMTLYGEVYIRI